MITVFLVSISYLWNDFLYVYFYKRIFKEKFNYRITFLMTMILWLIQFFTKIIPYFVFGLDMTVFLSLFMIVLHFVHLKCLFEGHIIKLTIAFVFAVLVQSGMDFLGLNITSIIVGNYDLYKMGSNFTVVALFSSCTTITIGMLLLTKIWRMIEGVNWKVTKREWLCMILPLSQIFFVWHIATKYNINYVAVPEVVMLGFVLSLIADVYMIVLFIRLGKKQQAEKELKDLQYQYELEKLRYEQLKEGQEKTAKMRHDFQNYILMMKQMNSL